jgi:hypothetical protein
MSNFIVEEERGTYTGRRHPNNGYYAFTGQTSRTAGRPPHHQPADPPHAGGEQLGRGLRCIVKAGA